MGGLAASFRVGARVVALLGLCAVGCTPRPPPRMRRDEPPPPVLVVNVDRVALRTSAWTELHALLATAARTHTELPDPDLDAAARAYEQALSSDTRDEALGDATRSVAACESEACARAALGGTPFGPPFALAFPGFMRRSWTARAASARTGIEAARSAIGPEIDGLARRIAKDLAFEWPEVPPIVDVVTDAPPPGAAAPMRALLGARGSCFTTPKPDPTEKLLGQLVGAKPKEDGPEPERVQHARIIDCVLVYAALHAAQASALRLALTAELGPREGDRAFTLATIHAVAVVMTSWDSRHISVLRQSAGEVAPSAMKWLVGAWPDRLQGEEPKAFAKRFAAELGSGSGPR
ncbi:MAG: hypothetical protein JST00_35635 [Deltaproteobacteria bacterium]|nr:hypothetical protein [Deltaproteobacteria bacterium]